MLSIGALMDQVLAGLLVAFFFSFCIFIHEFGHLLAAIWRGLHVERFSVGFGKPIKTWNIRGIEYMISWIPFGGYVAIPQLEPGDDIQTSDGRPLPPANPWDRIIVAIAGPLFNVLFGFALGVVIWQAGVPGPAPGNSFTVGHLMETYTTEEGETQPTPEFAAGLREGDIVRTIDGRTFEKGYNEAFEMITFADDRSVTLGIERDGQQQEITYDLVRNPYMNDLWYPFFEPREETMFNPILEPSPAYDAGFQPGDIVVSINGMETNTPRTIQQLIQSSEGEPMTFIVRRDGQLVTIEDVAAEWTEDGPNSSYRIGVGLESKNITILYPTPWEQFTNVLAITGKTVRSLFNRANPINASKMSGPVGIVHAMQRTFLVDLRLGLSLVVLITFSLAIVNLLPIPVLDGGHILFGLIEGFSRRRIPERVTISLQYVFAVLIISFALFVTFYDVDRIIRPPGRPPAQEEPATPAVTAPAEPAAPSQTETEPTP